MKKDQVPNRLEKALATFHESYAGLSDPQLMETGVTGEWSVKDILAHVTTWEEEALSDVLRQLDETHRRLIDYLQNVPEEHFTRETRFRHRLRIDTYSHYPLHARAIQEWRERLVK